MATDPSFEPSPRRPIRLHAEPAPVMRLSRRVLIGAAALSAAAVAGVVGWGLLARPPASATDGDVASAPPPPEKVDELPKDYAGQGEVPRLGPPLPGDLGRPFLVARGGSPASGATADAPSPQPSAADQERQAARRSQLFGLNAQAPASPASAAAPALPAPGAAASGAVGPTTAHGDFGGPSDKPMSNPERLAPPASPFVLQAGAVLPAALVTGIRSDLPGEIIGQVTQDVHDSLTGRYLLIPAGSRLLGRYDSQVAFGQSRVLLVWTRLLLPNGRSIVLDDLPGADPSGYAGLEDEVDRHWRALLSAAAVTSLLSVGTEVDASGSQTDLAMALRRAGADTANQVGQQVVGKSLSIPPTLIIRPGAAVRVLLTRDLVLEPYGA